MVGFVVPERGSKVRDTSMGPAGCIMLFLRAALVLYWAHICYCIQKVYLIPVYLYQGGLFNLVVYTIDELCKFVLLYGD